MASRRRRAGLLRQRGLNDRQLADRYEAESAELDEQQVTDLYGTDRERVRFTSAAASAPGYQSRGRPLLTDGQGRSYTPVGPHEPSQAYVYVDMAETRRRNRDRTLPVEFPRDGETVTLSAIRQRMRSDYRLDEPTYPLRVLGVAQERGRTASATVEFAGAVPQRVDLETADEERRLDAALRLQIERAERRRRTAL